MISPIMWILLGILPFAPFAYLWLRAKELTDYQKTMRELS